MNVGQRPSLTFVPVVDANKGAIAPKGLVCLDAGL
jgi:hypothetical protein